MNFTEQSNKFLTDLAARKRRPAKPATLRTYGSHIKNWIIPLIGELPIENFTNAAMKDFATLLVEKGKGPKTVREIVTLVKQIIGSVVDTEGNKVYVRQWNSDFIDLPDLGQQNQPILTPDMLIGAMTSKHKVFYALLAGTGLRIGEALAIRCPDDGVHTAWDPIKAVIRVRTSVCMNREQAPKTPASIREVDLELRLNNLLLAYEATNGVLSGPELAAPLFRNRKGGFMHERTLRLDLKNLEIPGFHAFRRFRNTRLRELGTPEDIIRYWAGHAGAGITDRYSKLAESVELRKTWAQRSGLGFELPEIS
jgi:integrase